METNKIYQGDVLEVLKTLPADSVHCCVTSPPYWGLRDYGVPGQLGLEKTPKEYVAKMVEVFREVRRVLRPDGTLFLNLGDSYASNTSNNGGYSDKSTLAGFTNANTKGRQSQESAKPHKLIHGLKPKDMVGIPWRVAFALQADGWYLRSDIIWHKPNPMPESVTDRPTKSHEYIFLLTKSADYFYDAEAIKEPVSLASLNDGRTELGKRGTKGEYAAHDGACGFDPSGRNKRTVWTVATMPYSEAHFATFPEKLIEPCILAGTSERGVCAKCGAQMERIFGKTGHVNKREPAYAPNSGPTKTDSTGWAPEVKFSGQWEIACQCNAGTKRGIILDPFMGAGTTALVSLKLNRSFLGIELNPKYIELAERRIAREKSQGKMF